jgi:2-polyprenyl-3-methyl-5-hydroxy-6-metoxy-1,4-benzoquinol methylase
MDIQIFLELFLKELEENPDLRGYFRLLNHDSMFLWRKAYVEQRLTYVNDQLGAAPGKVWDVGCGYGTTAIFLALSGYEVMGNTLEFYYDTIGKRLEYWSRYGNLDHLRIDYANLFDMPVAEGLYDAVIAQDTLHHLEPIQDAVNIIQSSLKPGGRLVATEENGNNVFINLKNLSIRGFKRVTEYYDERLGKTVLMGNENARSLHSWREILSRSNLFLVSDEVDYIRILPPGCYTRNGYKNQMAWERRTGKNLKLLRELLFFGINFTALKPL